MKGKHPTWYAFCRWVVTQFYNVRGGFSAVGREHIPKKGPIIFAPIHLSHLDPPAVAAGSTRRLRFMAKDDLFKGIFGTLITSLGAFPVRRGETDSESIRLSLQLLDEGEAVLIFPEGTRGDGKTLLPMNRGVAMLAKRSKAIVIPVAIIGTHVLLPKGQKKLGKGRTKVAFGKGFTYEQFLSEEGGDKKAREEFTNHMGNEIARLCQENGLNIVRSEA